nr:ATP-dependent RecD-like DNA helicase [Flavobacteriaceae bacterium]
MKKETIHGTIARVYFASPGFSAGVLNAGDGMTVKFRGAFQANVGDSVALRGKWERHAKFGRQFKVTGLSYDLPETPEGLVRYLADHKAFHGIGEVTARKLVDHAGSAEALDRLIRTDIEGLHRTLGIHVKALTTLRAEWISRDTQNRVHAYLSSFQLTPCQITTLFEKFGEGVIGVLQSDPYQLIQTVRGYGFKRVDKIARKMGVAKAHPGRIRAGLLHIIREDVRSGHTWTHGADLVDRANDLLLLDGLDSLEIIRKVAIDLLEENHLVADYQCVSLPRLRNDEQFILDTLTLYGNSRGHNIQPTASHTSGLLQGQLAAFHLALKNRIAVITGSAGTGKTMVLSRLARAFTDNHLNIATCAPTGKAAKRIEEMLRDHGLDLEAKTIHRLLGYDGVQFHQATIDADVIITDEASMISVDLFAELLRRIDFARSTLVLVGDHNQLPPVGPGSVLRDVIRHETVPVAILDQVVRQAGVLKANSTAVLSGRIQPADPEEREWLLIDKFKDPIAIQTCLRELITSHIPNRLGFHPIRDVQILSPTHRGPLGTREVNRMVQYLHHGAIQGRFTVGDRVVQKANDYSLEIFNGSIGSVLAVDKHGVCVHFDMEGERTLSWENASDLRLAYCMTIHSMQGSEAPCVVLLLHKSHWHACRQLTYTGVTRASKTLILLGDRWGIRNAVKSTRSLNRRTMIDEWMKRTRERSERITHELVSSV